MLFALIYFGDKVIAVCIMHIHRINIFAVGMYNTTITHLLGIDYLIRIEAYIGKTYEGQHEWSLLFQI